MQALSFEIKDIVFDYFNIITKEYEMAHEKYKLDEDYKNTLEEIKKQVEDEYIDKKIETIPETLTKEKTQQLVDQKQGYMNQVIMRMLQGGASG